jgi:hypothetical protein
VRLHRTPYSPNPRLVPHARNVANAIGDVAYRDDESDRADAVDGCSALGDLVGPVLQCQAGLPRVIRRGDGLLWAPVGALLDEL